MRNASPDEAQAGIKIEGISNLRCTDDTTFMAESKEELKRLCAGSKRKESRKGQFSPGQDGRQAWVQRTLLVALSFPTSVARSEEAHV